MVEVPEAVVLAFVRENPAITPTDLADRIARTRRGTSPAEVRITVERMERRGAIVVSHGRIMVPGPQSTYPEEVAVRILHQQPGITARGLGNELAREAGISIEEAAETLGKLTATRRIAIVKGSLGDRVYLG